MRKEETLILSREDMIAAVSDKDVQHINCSDFKIDSNLFQKSSIVLFIDDNNQSKILKNRYGL
jgi:hypothetical protein